MTDCPHEYTQPERVVMEGGPHPGEWLMAVCVHCGRVACGAQYVDGLVDVEWVSKGKSGGNKGR